MFYYNKCNNFSQCHCDFNFREGLMLFACCAVTVYLIYVHLCCNKRNYFNNNICIVLGFEYFGALCLCSYDVDYLHMVVL
jgi:hypothetical protein